jgi:hypothetical protein
MKLRLLAFAVVVVSGCRTTIGADHEPPRSNIFNSPDLGCSVHDYPSSTDVPEGAKNLGPVSVPREATDEETYVKLREAICEKGGNALSQLHWLNETTKDAPVVFALEANAWLLPEGTAR